MEGTNTEGNQPNGSQPPGGTGSEDPGGDDTVSRSAYDAVKADMHRYKEDNRKKDEELKKIRDQEMRDKDQWKEFAAAKEKDADEWKSKYESLSSSLLESAKVSAVKEQAQKLGLVDSALEDLELMDLKDVIVERTSTGRINVIGAKGAAERIKSVRPHWFSEKRAPNVNTGRPEVLPGQSGGVTYDDLKKLEAEAKKTGDYKEYHKKVIEFKKQR